MKILINGEDETIEKETLTINELLTHKKVDMPEMVTVEYNGEMLEREKFESQAVKDGDKIEFLYFMGGGN
jgi:sulfur carrier protein